MKINFCSISALLLLLAVAQTTLLAAEEEVKVKNKPLSKWLKQLQNKNRGIQVRAGRALSEAPADVQEKIIPHLLPLLEVERKNVRPYAAQALGCYGPKARIAVPKLLPMLKGTQYERNRTAAAKALGQILAGAETSKEVDEVVTALLISMNDKYLDVRRESVRALGMIGLSAKACIPHLTKRMQDAAAGSTIGRSVGIEGVWTCGVFGKLSAEHMDRLISIMHASPLPDVIIAIGKIGPVNENVVSNIVDRMEKVASGSVIVREGSRTHGMSADFKARNMQAGFDALEKFGPKSAAATDYLVHNISAKGWQRKKPYALGALKVLAAIGPAAKSAVEKIEKNCLTSKDADIKSAAEAALKKIKG